MAEGGEDMEPCNGEEIGRVGMIESTNSAVGPKKKKKQNTHK